MMSRNQPRPTKEEAQRMKIIKAGGCMLTWLKFGEKKYAEVHHIVKCGKRLGHWYTIPLSPWYNQRTCDPGKTESEMRAKYGASVKDGSKAFLASHHYTELELWQKLQVALGLDDELPKSKRVPRRVVHVEVITRGDPDVPREAPTSEVLPRSTEHGDSERERSEALAGDTL
jgi:hypothetical protein